VNSVTSYIILFAFLAFFFSLQQFTFLLLKLNNDINYKNNDQIKYYRYEHRCFNDGSSMSKRWCGFLTKFVRAHVVRVFVCLFLLF
jgi:hypothetical protein